MVTLTQQEKDTMNTELEALENIPDSGGLDPSIAQKTAVDVINKKFWDEANNRILNYETEGKNLDGYSPIAPVIEGDIVNCSNFTGRIYDGSSGNIFRHECFNGTPIEFIDGNEISYKNNIYTILNELVIGFIALANGETTTAWSNGTGKSDTNLPSGRYLVGNSIVNVTSSIINGTEYDITYTVISPAVINNGDLIGGFSGFTNTERQNKTASLQAVMDYYLDELESYLTNTVTVLNAIITAVTNNDDPNLSTIALTNHSNHLTFINGYLATQDISDAGIASFKTIEDARIIYVLTRVIEIDTSLIGLRDQRYNWSSGRANSSEGSLTLQKRLQFSKTAIDNKAQAMTDQKNFYENNMDLT